MYSYEDYLAMFYDERRRQGFTRSVNALRDHMLGIPQPMTREEFLAWQLEKVDPLAEPASII